MPFAEFFRGHPIKKWWLDGHHIKILLISPVKGQPGKKLLVSRVEFEQFRSTREVESTATEALRALIPSTTTAGMPPAPHSH